MQHQGYSKGNASGPPRRIGELLVREGLITPSQLQEALEKQRAEGGKIVENLIALGFLDTNTFLRFLSKQPGTASIDLLGYTIPAEVIQLVDREFALQHQIVPIDKMGRHLTVGMACPLDARTVAELEEKTGMKVRPLLVSMSDMNSALRNYYAAESPEHAYALDASHNVSLSNRMVASGAPSVAKAESALKFETVVHLIRKISALPALPETVQQVRDAMEDPDISTEELAVIVGRDPSLAAKVISLANSAAYSFTHRVDSVKRATALLGLREVYAVVVGSAVIEYFTEGKHFDHKQFWRRSMACAAACKRIARAKHLSGTGGLFAAGLLYDIGRAVFAEIAPKRYVEIDQNLPEAEIIQAENALFGVAHPEVGYLLAEGWGLPAEIAEPIRFHHDFQQAKDVPRLVAVVALGAVIAEALETAEPDAAGTIADAHGALLAYLEMDRAQIETVVDATRETMARQTGAL